MAPERTARRGCDSSCASRSGRSREGFRSRRRLLLYSHLERTDLASGSVLVSLMSEKRIRVGSERGPAPPTARTGIPLRLQAAKRST